jgi:HD-GYP domain-containing protein (c-di-GMP phosphodiesterase class II)
MALLPGGSLPTFPLQAALLTPAQQRSIDLYHQQAMIEDPTYSSTRVCAYALALGSALGLDADEMAIVQVGAILHDLGKLRLPQNLLAKTGALTATDWQSLRRHPLLGEKMCRVLDFPNSICLVVRHHHEWWDGQGYPDGLSGERIPLTAQIVAVADSFDAMVSDRPYRKGRPTDEALRELEAGSDSQWSTWLVDTFVSLIRSGELMLVAS